MPLFHGRIQGKHFQYLTEKNEAKDEIVIKGPLSAYPRTVSISMSCSSNIYHAHVSTAKDYAGYNVFRQVIADV